MDILQEPRELDVQVRRTLHWLLDSIADRIAERLVAEHMVKKDAAVVERQTLPNSLRKKEHS